MTNNVNTQPDYIALAIVAVLVVIVIVMVIRKWLSERNAPQSQVAPKEPTAVATAPGSAGRIKLNNVDPKTAALVMAIVADKMGKPLNELRFISIKEVEE